MSKPSKNTKAVSYAFAIFIGVLLASQSFNWKISIEPKEEIPWFVVPGLVLMGASLGIQIDPQVVDAIVGRRDANR